MSYIRALPLEVLRMQKSTIASTLIPIHLALGFLFIVVILFSSSDMAPSATIDELATSVSEVNISKIPEKHVHGAEDKTPLEAISHGPLMHPGMLSIFDLLSCISERTNKSLRMLYLFT